MYGRRSPASAPQKDEKTIASKVFGFFEKADSASDWLHADTALFRVGERLLDRNRRRAESKELMAEREAAHDAYLDAARTILWDIPWEWISRWRIQELAVSRHLRLDIDIRCSAPRGDYLTAARISGEVANDLALEGLASRLSERIPSQLVCSVLGRRVFQGVAQGPTGAFRPTILWSQQSEVPT